MDTSNIRFPLFPYKARLFSPLLFIPGLVSGYLYFFGGRPAFFEVPVFAVVTAYAETRFLVFAQTNLLDELFCLLCIGGLALFVFSKEKSEKEEYSVLRVNALIRSVYITLGFWLVCFLLIFGWAIFVVSTLLFIFFLITYYVTFRILVVKYLRRGQESGTKESD